ncbi:MAG: AAA family ATPase [Microlunatus sp.]|nr:AAA family ATPase [Microlunatus sp.]
MSRVLVTGMSGVGKSTLLAGLAQRGHPVVDTDYEGWILEDDRWDEPRMHDRLEHADSVVVSGTVENQVHFYGYFDHVVLLSVPLQTRLDRVTQQTSNPYGKRPEEQREIAGYLETVEPLLRRGATLELDGRAAPVRWSQPSSCSCSRVAAPFALNGD